MRHRLLLLMTLVALTTSLANQICRAEVEAVTSALHDLNLSFPVSGKVAIKHVKPGMAVKKGQTLMELENKPGEIDVMQKKLRAETDVAVHAAEAQLELDEIELEKSEKMHKEAALSELELLRVRARVKITKLQLKKAKVDQEDATLQHKLAVAQLAMYTLVAPIDGVVEKLEQDKAEEVSEGEGVEPLRPVIRLVVVKKLRVDAAVPTDKTLSLNVGGEAWVRSRLSSNAKPVKGNIIHIAKVADPASNTMLVRIEVPNEDNLLGAGWHVRIDFSKPALTQADDGKKENL